MNLKYGWKAFSTSSSGEFVSRIACGPARIMFPLGKKVHPKKGYGPITIFKSRKAAEYFEKEAMIGRKKGQIFPVIYRPSQKEYIRDNYKQVSLQQLMRVNTGCLLPGSVDLASMVIRLQD